ncbi:hypothetical protein PQX77_008394 [Marasmius sp. AFHP31]|nr:hypothetical protein PQX77_013007 [Marasmius sp. AFHP31]KAK1228529.1 hypothetical protein PQX77_008394 [Marasmius sp. AFHP31]
MEDGEIHDSSDSTRPSGRPIYDSSYEWPWDTTSLECPMPQEHILNREAEASPPLTVPTRSNSSANTCRLVVSHTRILPKLVRIARLDGYAEVQLGRDAAHDAVPRIRLREMEVSKLHATVYWDQSWNGWGIVDMGSKHGTFLRSSTGNTTESDPRGTRLSLPKAASVPKRLRHLDVITIGSTAFIVHIHEEGLPCVDCSPKQVENEIPLFPIPKKRTVSSREGSSDTMREPTSISSSKAALSQLKRELLPHHDDVSGKNTSTYRYVDRSARRRAMYPLSKADAPGVPVGSSPDFLPHETGSAKPPETPISQPAAPLTSSNVGHMLLVKQGWVPGTSLGTVEDGRVEPLDVKIRSDRSGLGASVPQGVLGSPADGYKGTDKYARWPGLR